MVAPGTAGRTPPLYGGTIEGADMITYCQDRIETEDRETVDENGEPLRCPGHLTKFDDCVQEALYELVLDNSGEQSTGTDEFEGTFTLFTFPADDRVAVNPDSSDERWVVIPAGCYILQTSSGGFVYTLKYGSYSEARDAYEVADARYCRWDKGCEQTPQHDQCEQHEECQLDGVPNY
jgi:hypothetical protein